MMVISGEFDKSLDFCGFEGCERGWNKGILGSFKLSDNLVLPGNIRVRSKRVPKLFRVILVNCVKI